MPPSNATLPPLITAISYNSSFGSKYRPTLHAAINHITGYTPTQIALQLPASFPSVLPSGETWVAAARPLPTNVSNVAQQISLLAAPITYEKSAGVYATVPKFCYIRDCKHFQAFVGGNNYDGNIYHQIDGERYNAQWQLIFADRANGTDYYYLYDRKHAKALVAGDSYNNRVYHQDPAGRLNAQWMFTPGTRPHSWFIKDRKHGKCLVAGDNDDNNAYHQDPNGRANAEWTIEIATH
ncbi:MAG: hypothetical protein KDC61_01870 [Saprospiraceae bacterium]|nr:hypothetical protein [Saprospiraceae bacterium]MCB0543271.1 hypothetical protein [Saprospiraceae bacterium]MCB0573296.1 hypothetical protein [Saprospiraceae bacterium]